MGAAGDNAVDLCLIATSSEELTAWINWASSIGMVALGLGFVIFVHELGHFLAAKACGVKAEKFYIGFDIPMPKIFGWQIPSTLARFQWGETEYGIGILPLGGYVKMLGQDDDPRKYKEEQARAKGETESDAAAAIMPVEPVASDKPVFDPRSYQAKSVPQRMLIISAGVIMNLIFAVIMGAVAYSMGVPYTPTIVGYAPAGSPAWTNDLRPGDHIVRIGATGYESDSLRFQHDLTPRIMLSNGDEIALGVQRGDERLEMKVRGRKVPDQKLYLLGVSPSASATVSRTPDPALLKGSPKAEDLPQPGDRILAVNGEQLPLNDLAFAEFQRILANHPGEALALTIERKLPPKEGEKDGATLIKDVTLPPQSWRSLGLTMGLGPVAAVRKGSPAYRTGIQPGDQIVSINGEPIGDPLTLSQRLLKLEGQTNVPIEVLRMTADQKKSEKRELKIDPEAPLFMNVGATGIGGDMVGIESLGIAAPVDFKVLAVSEAAAKAGLKEGDEVVGVQFIVDPKKAKEAGLHLPDLDKPITLEQERQNWVWVNGALQEMPAGTKVEVTFRRDGKEQVVMLTPETLDDAFFEPRGLGLRELTKVRTAANFAEAWALGFRETKDKLGEVANVLRGLLTGRVSPKNLGSPIMIAQVAFSEASHGWGRLLIFLTFLSANLALLNFLPIPVLDGGHMVFLAAEGIRGKPVDEQVQYYALLVGAAMLLGLMVFVFSNDIVRLLS
jgi:regulator of sigma E protease